MRHRKVRYQLNRFSSWRRATLRDIAKSLFMHQSIKTTKTKAKAAKPLIEKLITLAKNNSLAAKRQAYRVLCDHKLVNLLFNDIASRFSQRQSGYTRIINLDTRRGDNAQLAILELTEIKKKEPKKPKEEKKPGAIKEKPIKEESEEKKPKQEVKILEKPPIIKKPPKKFLGGLRNIFKKERDAL